MEKEFKLGALNIFELGNEVSRKLHDYGVKEISELHITVDKDNFKKIDEDLYYRLVKEENGKYVPSEGEINVGFNNLKIVIREKQGD